MRYAVYWNGTLYARFAHLEQAKLYLQAVCERFAYVNPEEFNIKEENTP